MNVGVAKVTLRLPSSHSLKEKRRVVSSIRQRVRAKFDVAIAEVERQDTWQVAVLGIASVSNSAPHAQQALEAVMRFIESDRPDAEMIDCELEIITGF